MSSTEVTGSAVIGLADHLRHAWYRTIWRIMAFIVLAATIAAQALSPEFDVTIWITFAAVLTLYAVTIVGLTVYAHIRLSAGQKAVTYRVTEQSIALYDATGAAVVHPWTCVKKIAEHPSGFVITLKPFGMRWIPRRAFDAQSLEAFRTLAKTAIGKLAS